MHDKANLIYKMYTKAMESSDIPKSLSLIQGMSEIALNQYPVDVQMLLNKYNILNDVKKWREFAKNMQLVVNKVDINIEKFEMLVTCKDKTVKYNLYDVNYYLKDKNVKDEVDLFENP